MSALKANNGTSVVSAAKKYANNDWAPVPVPIGEKGPKFSAWQKTCQRRGKNTPFAGAIIHHCGGVKVHQLLQSNTRCYGLSR